MNGLVKLNQFPGRPEQTFPVYPCTSPTSQTFSPLSSAPCPFTCLGKSEKEVIRVKSLP